jgi:hypothetical protein
MLKAFEIPILGFDHGPSGYNSHALRAEHAGFVPFVKVIRAPKCGPCFTAFLFHFLSKLVSALRRVISAPSYFKIYWWRRRAEIYFCDILMLHLLFVCSLRTVIAFTSFTVKTVNLLTTVAFRWLPPV